MKKLIIMLSAKRCGSPAIFNLFQKHADVKVLQRSKDFKLGATILVNALKLSW